MNIGKRLRELRVALGLSQYELAHLSDLQQPYICNVERGAKVPQLSVLERWTKALGVPLSEFFHVENTLPKNVKVVRLTFYEQRLLEALRRMSEADRRLFLSVAATMAKGGPNLRRLK